MTFSIEDIYDTDEHGGRAGPHPLDCTCGARAPAIHSPTPGTTHTRPTRDIDCPVHGLDALLAHPEGGDDATWRSSATNAASTTRSSETTPSATPPSPSKPKDS